MRANRFFGTLLFSILLTSPLISQRLPSTLYSPTQPITVQNPSPPPVFNIRPEIRIGGKDGSGRIAGQRSLPKDIGTMGEDSHADATPTDDMVTGLFSFDLLPGEYTVTTEIDDRDSNRKYTDGGNKIQTRPFGDTGIGISDVAFLERSPSVDVVPPGISSYGGIIPFGHPCTGYTEFTAPASQHPVRIFVSVYRPRNEEIERVLMLFDSISTNAISQSLWLAVSHGGNHDVYRRLETVHHNRYAAWMNIRSDTLPVGTYELEWMHMPVSLRNLDLSVDALSYVVTEAEMRRFHSTNEEGEKILFEKFWRSRDKTPRTAYNEMMAEYYRRVDHTLTAFSALRQPIDVRSDRSKVYILYGAPGEIQRRLQPSGPAREIWLYPNLHKRFLFTDETRQGDFTLE